MKLSDRELGMHRGISRRDFFNGVAATAVGAALPGGAGAAFGRTGYPPARSGLRGSHPGSYEVAHALTWGGKRDWGTPKTVDDEYDLVVVGAGISGLAAAHFYRQQHPGASVLLLDNHDDFGGHAKRNEFELDGKPIIGYGGSQALEEPTAYSRRSKALLKDLGVDTDRFYKAYDLEFFARNGLTSATYFNADHFGRDQLMKYSLMDYEYFVPSGPGSIPAAQAVPQMPLSDNARRELLRLIESSDVVLKEKSRRELENYLWATSLC